MRQYEYELNEAGLLTWTDRGDYHRSGTRDAQGRIVFAHGVDLSPGAVMLPKLLEIDSRRRDELKERAGLRGRISRLKGYVKPRLARAIEDGLADPDNAGWRNGVKLLSIRTRAKTPLERLKDIAGQLTSLEDTLNGLVNTDAHDKENHGAGCGKARKTCGRTRKATDAPAENYRPIYTTRDSKTDKSVTSTQPCEQSTASSGKTDAPCGAKSSLETVDGRKKTDAKGRGGAARHRSSSDSVCDGPEPGGGPACSPQGDGPWRREEGPIPGGRYLERRRDGLQVAREACGGATANDPGLTPRRPPKGGLEKPDTGTRHLSLLNVLETAGSRFLDRVPRTCPPDWGEIEAAAEDLCPDLGIGPQVWWMAVTVMGRRDAAVCVMLIDRKMCPGAEEPVRCPGAYLRGMTNRARDGKLRLHASVFGWTRRAAA